MPQFVGGAFELETDPARRRLHRAGAILRHAVDTDLDDAIADFTSALNRNPKFVDAFKNRGLAYKMQGASDKAIDDFHQAIRLDGSSPGLYNLRGAALLDKLEFNRAIADFDKDISLNQKYRNA